MGGTLESYTGPASGTIWPRIGAESCATSLAQLLPRQPDQARIAFSWGEEFYFGFLVNVGQPLFLVVPSRTAQNSYPTYQISIAQTEPRAIGSRTRLPQLQSPPVHEYPNGASIFSSNAHRRSLSTGFLKFRENPVPIGTCHRSDHPQRNEVTLTLHLDHVWRPCQLDLGLFHSPTRIADLGFLKERPLRSLTCLQHVRT